jgi:type IV secretory pathway VirB3-like protein
MAAWVVRIIIWTLVAIRPSYRLLFFCAGILAGITYLALAFNGGLERLVWLAVSEAILLGVGIPIVALRKWMRARSSEAITSD